MARPALRLRLAPKFPSRVIGTSGIDVAQSGGTTTLAMDWSDFQENVGTLDPGLYEILGYDGAAEEFIRLPLSTARTAAYREVTIAGAVTVTASDGVIGINKTIPEVTAVNLLAAASGFPLTVKDVAGNAGTYDITLTPSGAETIDGAASFVMDSDFQSITLTPVSGGWITNAEYSGDTAVVPGTYTFAAITVDQRGRVTFVQSGTVPTAPAGILSNASLAASVGSSALTISLNTADGTTPSLDSGASIPFRSATSATGTITQRTVGSATTLTISSGSTMGFANATAGRLWIVAFDDAGTVRLGAINCLSGEDVYPLAQFGIASSTAEGGAGAADSAQVFYTSTAVTSKAYTVLGYLEWSAGLATAGTWGIVPTGIEVFRPGVKLPGDVIRRARGRSTASSDITSANTIPNDNTKPQIGEGLEVVSKAFVPTSAANLIRARFDGEVDGSTLAYAVIGMFNGATDAVAANFQIIGAAGYSNQMWAEYTGPAGTTSSQTWSVRAGPTAGTIRFNGAFNGARFNGALGATLVIEEIVA